MSVFIPQTAAQYGFVCSGLGTHSSRTMMLEELQLLLAACPPTTDLQGYRSAILDANVLLKQTESTRQKSLRHLRELYGLEPSLPIFGALRALWYQDAQCQPLLALFCSIARDPSLRATTDVIIRAIPGTRITPQMLAQAVEEGLPTSLGDKTLATIGRNTASTWTQSGYLVGYKEKVRAEVRSHPLALAYALFLGYLCGERGEALFHTPWAQLLDAPVHVLREQALGASRQGWLEYRHAGGVTDISFRHFLSEESHE